MESGSWVVQRLFEKVPTDAPAADVRVKQARAACGALLRLFQTRQDLYEFDALDKLASSLLASDETFDQGLEFAALIKSNQMQTLLVDRIGDPRVSIESRRKALAAFESQLANNGSLLRGPDVKRMYDRYNASEKESKEMQQILSDMLDVYERATSGK